MAQDLNNNTDCCQSSCTNSTVNTPGPQGATGAAGSDGTNGTNGISAYTRTTAGFTVPAVNSNVAIPVQSAQPFGDQVVFINSVGYYQIVGTSQQQLTVKNLGYTSSPAPGDVITATNLLVTPSGVKGADGTNGSGIPASLNAQGEIIVHSGSSVDVLGPGSNGQLMFYNSAQNLGVETRKATFSDIDGDLDLSTQVTNSMALTHLSTLGATQGDILYFDGVNWTRLNPASGGDYLVYDSVNNKPSWSAPSSQGLQRLAHVRMELQASNQPVTTSNTTNIGSVTVISNPAGVRIAFSNLITASNPIILTRPVDADAKTKIEGLSYVSTEQWSASGSYSGGYIDFLVDSTTAGGIFDISVIG